MAKSSMLQNIEKDKAFLIGPSGRFSVRTEGEPPCKAACPAGVDVKAYVNLIADWKYEDAVRVVRYANPFPGICGRVCTHQCESECGRKDIDESVSIRSLKRFAADYELSRKKPILPAKRTNSQKIAVIGAGPAGLTAASDLALEGFPVTVFDSAKEAGGLLSWGIPDFRLPKNIVRSEVADIKALGVEFSLGETVRDPAKLLSQGYSAVILATGCQVSLLPGIPGEKAEGVIDCLDFLRKVSEKQITAMQGAVTVIGGGNAALDSARTALRLGAKVTVAYRRTEEQMPADREEIEHAKQEGVIFRFLAIPTEVISDRGKVKSFRFQSAKLGEPDESGRRSPVPIANDYFTLENNTVIMAIGSKPETSLVSGTGIDLKKGGIVKTADSGMTSVRGIFACGDIATGPLTIIDAIGGGHRAAAGVIGYVSGEPTRRKPTSMLVIENANIPESQRCRSCFIPAEKRQSTFDEVELGMDERTAINEALRCQRCGSCDECDVCLAVCDYRNAAITVAETGETAVAKVPFALAHESLVSPDEDWALEIEGAKHKVEVAPILALVNRDLCIACGKCEESCPYKAIRTVFDTKGRAFAHIESTSCRGCGACAGACPSGAIKMGYMDDERLFAEVREAVKNSADNNGIVRFSCMWNRRNLRTEPWPWEVRLQCTRRVSPALLTETLALGVRAVAVVGCEEGDCHYLPGPLMATDTVSSTRSILEAVGTSQGRITFIDSVDSVTEFFTGISRLAPLRPASGKLPQIRHGLGRTLDAVQVLMAQPDSVQEFSAKDRLLVAYGCLSTSEPAFRAYGIRETDIQDAILKLLGRAGIKFEIARGVHISGTSLRDWGMDSLYRDYSRSIVEKVRSSKAATMAVATPKSFETLSKVDFGCRTVTLPSVLLKELRGVFAETDETVAYHRACAGGGRFDEDCIALLAKVPGLNISKIEGDCGDTGWRDVTSGSRDAALKLLKKAEKAGISTVVTGSTRCSAHLNSVLGGWNTSPVRVMDVYTFLAEKLRGDE